MCLIIYHDPPPTMILLRIVEHCPSKQEQERHFRPHLQDFVTRNKTKSNYKLKVVIKSVVILISKRVSVTVALISCYVVATGL